MIRGFLNESYELLGQLSERVLLPCPSNGSIRVSAFIGIVVVVYSKLGLTCLVVEAVSRAAGGLVLHLGLLVVFQGRVLAQPFRLPLLKELLLDRLRVLFAAPGHSP